MLTKTTNLPQKSEPNSIVTHKIAHRERKIKHQKMI